MYFDNCTRILTIHPSSDMHRSPLTEREHPRVESGGGGVTVRSDSTNMFPKFMFSWEGTKENPVTFLSFCPIHGNTPAYICPGTD